MEYMCTIDETINTGINIDTVNESKLNPQNTSNDSESIHLKSWIVTGMLFNPTSKKVNIEIIVAINTKLHVINCAPLTPIFLPKNPETIDPNKGKVIKAKYII